MRSNGLVMSSRRLRDSSTSSETIEKHMASGPQKVCPLLPMFLSGVVEGCVSPNVFD